jgi:hypothetical protein
MERTQVQSTTLHSIGYDPVERVLEVKFRQGGGHRYLDVPEAVYLSTMHAEQVTKAFNELVRDRFTRQKVG